MPCAWNPVHFGLASNAEFRKCTKWIGLLKCSIAKSGVFFNSEIQKVLIVIFASYLLLINRHSVNNVKENYCLKMSGMNSKFVNKISADYETLVMSKYIMMSKMFFSLMPKIIKLRIFIK